MNELSASRVASASMFWPRSKPPSGRSPVWSDESVSSGEPVSSNELTSSPRSSSDSSAVWSTPDATRVMACVSTCSRMVCDARSARYGDSIVGVSCVRAVESISRVGSSSTPRRGSSSRKSMPESLVERSSLASSPPVNSISSLPASPASGPKRSTSTRFSPPSRLRSTTSVGRDIPASPWNMESSGLICRPMMRILSHSPGSAASRVS